MADQASTILVVDDEPGILQALEAGLVARGYDVVATGSGAGALEAVRRIPDVVVLDLGLPDLDGVEICRRIRSWTDIPIIVLSADGSDHRKVAALDEGADDYITKPFSMPELLARVRVALRHRSQATAEPDEPVLQVGDLTVDLSLYRVRVGDREVDLTPKEFAFLALLARHPGRVFTRPQLLDAVRGEGGESFDRAIDAHVKNLRRKLEPDTRNPRYVLTVYGVGYKAADS